MGHKSVHFIGIGGSGLSAIARLLLEKGYAVSGSDRQDSLSLKELQAAGARVYTSHSAENVIGADIVVRSSAVPIENEEVQAALKLGTPVLKRSEYLHQLLKKNDVIAIAGTHGKTTTTAMVAWVLTSAGLDASYIIGGMAKNLHSNAHAGKSSYFVIEADEYDRMFLGLEPNIAVITNIDHDHPDCYPTPEDFYQGFHQFSKQIKKSGSLVICADNQGSWRLLNEHTQNQSILCYGMNNPYSQEHIDYLAVNDRVAENGGYTFDVYHNNEMYTTISLRIPGIHNILNALATIAVADLLQIPIEKTKNALCTFCGTSRRFEIRGEFNGITMIDDYAHHPNEIKATISAAKAAFYGRQIWVVWQPHTYSRTLALWNDYLEVFGGANHLVISDVFAARENRPINFSLEKLVQGIQLERVHFIPQKKDIELFLKKNLVPGDVLLVLSAGDATEIITHLLETNKHRCSEEFLS